MEVFQMLIAIEGRERSNSKASGRGDTSQKVSERALRRTSILAMNQHPRNGYRHNGCYIHY